MRVNIDIPEQLLQDILVTAVEGGSNYWAEFRHIERDSELNILKVTVVESEASTDRAKSAVITPCSLSQGLELLSEAKFPNAKPCLSRIISEDYDAGDADVILQLTVLGEVVYG